MIRSVANEQDVALPLLELFDDLHGSANAAEERRWTHGALDLEVTEIIGEVEQAVPELDARHVLAYEHATKTLVVHGGRLSLADSALLPSLKLTAPSMNGCAA